VNTTRIAPTSARWMKRAALVAATALAVEAFDLSAPVLAHASTSSSTPEASNHASAEHGSSGDTSHASTAEHSGHESHGPAAINWLDVFDKHRPAVVALFINFGLLATLYYTLGKKPVSDGLKRRKQAIGQDIEEAQQRLTDAKQRAAKYQADLKNVEADAASAKSALIVAGEGEASSLVTEAQERAERMKHDAALLVTQERKQIEQDLRRSTVEESVAVATKLLEKTVTHDDHVRLANDLLADLTRRPSGSIAPASRAEGAS